MSKNLSRRDFLKLSGVGLGALAFRPLERVVPLPNFQTDERLGRVSVTPYFFSTEIKSAPSRDASTVRVANEDTVVQWLRSVVGSEHYGVSRNWVETPEGFIYEPHLQPVRNQPNQPLTAIPDGKPGFWAEVTVPYVDMALATSSLRSPSFKYLLSVGEPLRLYYSQVIWIDQVATDQGGRTVYRFNEDAGHGYGYGDMFWVDATALRLLTPEDVSPISPEVDPNDKHIQVDVTNQTLSCFEGEQEVYFCRISSGVGDFSTPVGEQFAHWKIFSIHMSANTASDSGYDTAGVSWPTFINKDGVAIHAVFWHNDFGMKRSHGCINVLPEDAKWVFRWTNPYISLDQSEIRMQWPNVGTKVIVTERSF
jgi:hypothetical protein